MQVEIECVGSLKGWQPDSRRLEVPEGATIAEALSRLGIPASEVHVVLRNGSPQPDHQTPLAPDDRITVLPLVGGG